MKSPYLILDDRRSKSTISLYENIAGLNIFILRSAVAMTFSRDFILDYPLHAFSF